MANVHLVEGLKTQVGPLIVVHEDGPQMDVKDLGLAAFGNMGADHVYVIGGGPPSDAAGPLEQVQNGLGTLVSRRVLEAHRLTEEVDALAVILGDPDLDPARRHADRYRHQAGALGRRSSFDGRVEGFSQFNAAIGTERVRTGQIGTAGDANFHNVRATDQVTLGHVLITP